MLFLPAAALCCLCSALVAMAAELIQDQLSLTKRAGETDSLSCVETKQCDKKQVYWYQKTETNPLRVILRIDLNDGVVNSRYNHPEKDDFTASRKSYGCDLVITKMKPSHSATYYCACWKNAVHVSFTVGGPSDDNKFLIFGSGTRLFIRDEPVVKPVVSVYPAASRAHLEGKSSLLCLASAMSPPLVQFSWKRQKDDGPLEELPAAEREQLELREPGRTAAILLIRQPQSSTYKYRCYVEHEGGTVEAQTQEVSAPPPPAPVQHWFRERLLCLIYTVLIVKSLVYCCGLCL